MNENNFYTVYNECHWNPEAKEMQIVCTWKFSAPNNSTLAIEKIGDGIPPKMFFVEEDGGYVFHLLKTKIKARGGARGLCEFMRDVDGHGSRTWTDKILNYCWYKMRPLGGEKHV